jgi:DNA helicase-2/ATP-dependent DNA helicase PcrA
MQAILSEISNRNEKVMITLPSRLSVSTLLYLAKDPQELALRLRRPMPNHIDKYARRGTDFHLWLENHFEHPSLISMDDLFNQSSSVISEEFADAPLDKLQHHDQFFSHGGSKHLFKGHNCRFLKSLQK